MKELRELARSAHHLMVFEAAARNQSFTAAAHELGVTQPAVSRSVRQLEATLGVNLFTRSHRSVELTEAGDILSRAMAGEGIAMGWAHLVDGLVEQGLLVRIGNHRYRTNRSFYLIWSNETPLSPQAEAVRGWIVEAASSLFPPHRANAGGGIAAEFGD